MDLNPQNVHLVFLACVPKEPPGEQIEVEGIVHQWVLETDPLEENRAAVHEMLRQLPERFFEDGGHGWSFLNACVTNDDHLWTSEHLTMEKLFVLGIGLGVAKPCLPREYWPSMPGGMPYYVVSADPAGFAGVSE